MKGDNVKPRRKRIGKLHSALTDIKRWTLEPDSPANRSYPPHLSNAFKYCKTSTVFNDYSLRGLKYLLTIVSFMTEP